jgi:hypothetical protein
MTRGSIATDVRRPYAEGPRGRHVGGARRVRTRESAATPTLAPILF